VNNAQKGWKMQSRDAGRRYSVLHRSPRKIRVPSNLRYPVNHE